MKIYELLDCLNGYDPEMEIKFKAEMYTENEQEYIIVSEEEDGMDVTDPVVENGILYLSIVEGKIG